MRRPAGLLFSIAVMVLCVACGCEHAGVSTASRKPAGLDIAEAKTKTAKRMGPAEVPPVTIGTLKFAPIHWGKSRGLGQNGGYIAAYDAATDKELWILKVYTVDYDPGKEDDVQDVFIQSMTRTASGDELQIVDEEGRQYIVNPLTRSVRRP